MFYFISAEYSPVKYKRYVKDSRIPVPRTTQYNHKKKKQTTQNEESMDFLTLQLPLEQSVTVASFETSQFTNEASGSDFEERRKDITFTSLNETEYAENYAAFDGNKVVPGNSLSVAETDFVGGCSNHQFENDTIHLNIPDQRSPSPVIEHAFGYNNMQDKIAEDSMDTTDMNEDMISDESYCISSESDSDANASFDLYFSDDSSDDIDKGNKPSDDCDRENKAPKFSEFDETCMTLLSFILKHHLSWQSSNDFIELFKFFSNYTDNISIDRIKQTVGNCQPNIIDFCDKCLSLFPDDEEIVVCSQERCGGLRFKGAQNKQCEKRRKSYFVCLPLHRQIKDIIERRDIWESICKYKEKCKTSTSITDILNGEMYQSFMETEDACSLEENSLSLLFNTDGAPLYKSSGVSIWPVYLVINELPPALRFSRKNIILWGVWQAKGKPMFQTFFHPFVKQMNELKNDGITVEIHDEKVTIKVILLAGTMDLQAKALITEMTAHNGQFGCLTCEEPGEVVKRGKGHCRVFPYRQNPATLRTSAGKFSE